MALTIGQTAAVSYAEVLNEARTPENQWMENAAMREMKRQGFIKSRSFGETLQAVLDYRRNPNAGFLATSNQTLSLAKTEVITAASYDIAELAAPVSWYKKDEVQNPTRNQKVAFTKGILTNGFDSHDDLIEEALFAASSTNGFHSFAVLVPTSGQSTVGGISAADEVWWRNPADTYLADGSDMESVLTEVWNSAAKGTGSNLSPTMIVSGDTSQALFESTQVPFQRYVDTQELKAGFKVIAFKTARWCFSQYGGTKIYMANPKSLNLVTSKEYFRDKGETKEMDDAAGFTFQIYSALQLVTNNKSRLAVIDEA
jgi:hypothetical protein